MGTTIVFRRGSTFPSQGSGITLAEPVFNTNLNTFHIGLGHGVTAEWIGAPISGASASISSAEAYKIPTAKAVKDYVTDYVTAVNGVLAVNGFTGGITLAAGTGVSVAASSGTITITNTGVQSFNGLTGAVTGVTVGGQNNFTALNTFNAGISASGGITFGNDIFVNGIRVGRGEAGDPNSVAIGSDVLPAGTFNVAIGKSALQAAVNPTNNVAIGFQSGMSGDSPINNVSIGANSLRFNVFGQGNVAIGYEALYSTTNNANTAIGSMALRSTSTGIRNTSIGNESLYSNTSGVANVAIGHQAGRYRGQFTAFDFPNDLDNEDVSALSRTTGTGGIYIGQWSRASANGTEKEIVIGTEALGLGSNTAVIGATSQVSATIYGTLNLPSGLSASGATFSGNIAANNIVNAVNGKTGGITLAAGTGVSVAESSGTITITNTGVQSFNGLTGAVGGVTTSVANTFTALQTFTTGISAAGGVTLATTLYAGTTAQLGSLDVRNGSNTRYMSFVPGPVNQIIAKGPSYLNILHESFNPVYIGDYDAGNNGTYIEVDDGNAAIKFHNGGNVYTFPVPTGLSGQVLTDDGLGNLYWGNNVSTVAAGTGISVSGATGAVTITNTGVQSFNGSTGAVQGVRYVNGRTGDIVILGGTNIGVTTSGIIITVNNEGVLSVNGATGAINNVARTNTTNTFTELQTFSNASGISAAQVFTKTVQLPGNETNLTLTGAIFSDSAGIRLLSNDGLGGDYHTTVKGSVLSADRTITFPDTTGTVALTSQLMGAVNGSTAATTAVTSFNGLTGAIQGVSSINGSTGAITNVAFTNVNNNFSSAQTIDAAGAYLEIIGSLGDAFILTPGVGIEVSDPVNAPQTLQFNQTSTTTTVTLPNFTTTLAGLAGTQTFTGSKAFSSQANFSAGISASGATFNGNISAPNIVNNFGGATGGITFGGYMLTWGGLTSSYDILPLGYNSMSAPIATLPTVNNAYFCPIFINRNVKIKTIGHQTGTSGTGNTGQMMFGLYSSDNYGYPDVKLYNSSGITLSTTAFATQRATVNYDVSPGLYWLAIIWSAIGSSTSGYGRLGGRITTLTNINTTSVIGQTTTNNLRRNMGGFTLTNVSGATFAEVTGSDSVCIFYTSEYRA